jgi:hypothetical protein
MCQWLKSFSDFIRVLPANRRLEHRNQLGFDCAETQTRLQDLVSLIELALIMSGRSLNSLAKLLELTFCCRIIRAYIRYYLRRNPALNAKEVSAQTPRDINMFITQKCGPAADGFEGPKARLI